MEGLKPNSRCAWTAPLLLTWLQWRNLSLLFRFRDYFWPSNWLQTAPVSLLSTSISLPILKVEERQGRTTPLPPTLAGNPVKWKLKEVRPGRTDRSRRLKGRSLAWLRWALRLAPAITESLAVDWRLTKGKKWTQTLEKLWELIDQFLQVLPITHPIN